MLALAGCMRVYPDSELPDVEVEWFDGDCDFTGVPGATVAAELVGIDDPTHTAMLAGPCKSQRLTFVDVARERYRVTGSLLDQSNRVLGSTEADVDLRNGLDQTAPLFFGFFGPNLLVAWTFDMDATCGSLAADTVSLQLVPSDGTPPLINDLPCELLLFNGYVPIGSYSLRASAVSAGTTVAVAPAIGPFAISEKEFTDAGTLTLSPCAPCTP